MSALPELPMRPLTVEDLYALPDDGHRYELVDGSLVVSPPAANLHQVAATQLLGLILAARTPEIRPLVGGSGIRLRDDRFLIPDLLVARSDADFRAKWFGPEEVVLVVEVVSPSNAVHDLVTKRELYRQHGIPHYWLVDTRAEPTLTALRLVDGHYVETVAGPDDVLTVDDPFPLTVRPADLVR